MRDIQWYNNQYKNIKSDPYVGFFFGDYHSTQLGIKRTSNNNRYTENLLPTIDKTTKADIRQGVILYRNQIKDKELSFSFAFDSVTSEQFNLIKQTFFTAEMTSMVLDEDPFTLYEIKLKSAPVISYLVFDENDRRIYKGDCQLSFIIYNMDNSSGGTNNVIVPLEELIKQNESYYLVNRLEGQELFEFTYNTDSIYYQTNKSQELLQEYLNPLMPIGLKYYRNNVEEPPTVPYNTMRAYQTCLKSQFEIQNTNKGIYDCTDSNYKMDKIEFKDRSNCFLYYPYYLNKYTFKFEIPANIYKATWYTPNDDNDRASRRIYFKVTPITNNIQIKSFKIIIVKISDPEWNYSSPDKWSFSFISPGFSRNGFSSYFEKVILSNDYINLSNVAYYSGVQPHYACETLYKQGSGRTVSNIINISKGPGDIIQTTIRITKAEYPSMNDVWGCYCLMEYSENGSDSQYYRIPPDSFSISGA